MLEPEIVEPLTPDEETVLLILAQGECLAPIGRWEKPLKSLVTRGFAVAHNESNYGATEAGKALAERKDDQFFRGWIEGSNRAVARRGEAGMSQHLRLPVQADPTSPASETRYTTVSVDRVERIDRLLKDIADAEGSVHTDDHVWRWVMEARELLGFR